MSSNNSENPESASIVEEVEINLRNINTGDTATVKCSKDGKCTPVALFHKAGWSFVGNDSVIMVAPQNVAVTPTVERSFNDGETLVLSNKGTSAGL